MTVMPCCEPTVLQSEVRVRAGVDAWHLVRVHWLEYRLRVLCADFTLFLDTGSEGQRGQSRGRSLPETVRARSHHPGALPAPPALPAAAFRHGQRQGTGPAAQHPAAGQQERPSARGRAGTGHGAPALPEGTQGAAGSARLAHACLAPVSASTPALLPAHPPRPHATTATYWCRGGCPTCQ